MSGNRGVTVMVQGRIVWVAGDLFKGKIKTIFGTNKPMLNDQGEQIKEYGFGLAVPKTALQETGEGQPGHIWQVMHEEAMSLYPGGQIPPSFAMKYKDGDGIDDKGQPMANRTGYAGHIVLSCTTRLPIKFFKWENNGNVQINEGIKCGDYINVQMQVKAHGAIGQGKPGLYMNPNAVQFLGFGEEIINAPSGDQMFGNAQPAMPAGASATPLAPQGGAQLVSTEGAFGGPALAQPAPAPMPAQQPVQQAAPAPHHGVLPQNMQPTPAPAMPAQQPVQQAAPAMPAQQPVQQAAPAMPAQQPVQPPTGFPVPGQ